MKRVSYVSGNPPLEPGQTREFVDSLCYGGVSSPRVIFITLSWEPPMFNSRRMRSFVVWAEDGDDPDCYNKPGEVITLYEDVGFHSDSRLL